MGRATWLLASTTLVGAVTSVWLYFDNRALRADLEGQPAPAVTATAEGSASGRARDPWVMPSAREAPLPSHGPSTVPPALPEEPKESRLDRRARRTKEFGEMFGRHEGETDDDYRARIAPLIVAGLAIPRARAEESLRLAAEKAHVTPEQSAKLDKTFDKIYGDVLDYTNKAIADGTLSPYERNVAGWLEFAGGLGGLLTDAQGQVGKVLDPGQMKAMYDAGFEWGEYLGVNAPWEQLQPPPPPRP